MHSIQHDTANVFVFELNEKYKTKNNNLVFLSFDIIKFMFKSLFAFGKFKTLYKLYY
jgi:hypothetical protein